MRKIAFQGDQESHAEREKSVDARDSSFRRGAGLNLLGVEESEISNVAEEGVVAGL